MLQLNLPSYCFKLKDNDGRQYIFDRLRKKYVALTPEEWVRQHFIEYLVQEKGFPASLIANEHSIAVNGRCKRCDTVVYNNQGAAVLIVEYKAPSVEITQQTFDQIAIYNTCFRVNYLIVSNGMNHYCCAIDYETMAYRFLPEIPHYSEII